MESNVLQENAVLEVEFTVPKLNSDTKPIESEKLMFHDSLVFQAKRKSSWKTDSGRYSTCENTVLVRVQTEDVTEKSTYRIKLSCTEFKIKEIILYSDDSLWHVLNENNISDKYTFKLKLHVEVCPQIKFSVLYEDEQLTDFKLKAQDGEVTIHKAFLAAISAVFRSKLVNDMNENLIALDVPETSVKTLQDFKKCIYLDVLPNENLEELLLLASYFKINWLEIKCVDKMMTNMSSVDAMNMLEFALTHKLIPLFLGIMDHVQCGNIKMSAIRNHYLQQSVDKQTEPVKQNTQAEKLQS